MEKDYFIIIPPELRKSKKFSLSEKMVLAAIVVLSKKEGYAWISNNALAEDLGISRRTVIRSIKGLEEKKAVEIRRFTEGDIERRTITPSKGVVTKLHWGGAKMSRGVVTKLHPNITSNNITSEYTTGNTTHSSRQPENLDQAIAFFKEQKSTKSEAQKFYHYYEAIGWMVGKNPVQNWRALAHKWIAQIKPQKDYKILT